MMHGALHELSPVSLYDRKAHRKLNIKEIGNVCFLPKHFETVERPE